MTRMTGPDCVVMCNLINTYIHTYMGFSLILKCVCVCVCVCVSVSVFIKLHITAQSGLVILVILCHSR